MGCRGLRLVAVAGVIVAAAGCVEVDDTVLEPLSGTGERTSVAVGADGLEVLGEDVAVEELPEEVFEDAPPGFGERPFEELDLPPDEPPPPVEAGPAPAPVAPPTPSTSPTAPPTTSAPPAARPSGALDPASLAVIGDYCTLFRENGQVLVLAEQTMSDGPPARVPDVLTFAEAVFRRGGELGPGGLRSSHDQIASAMRSYRELLAEHGNDIEQVTSTDAGLSRLAAIESPQFGAAIESIANHVAGSCGVSIL
jgi:hypothetical protein